MSRCHTASFVVERPLWLEPWQYDKLNKMMNAANKLYNTAVKHCMAQMAKFKQDSIYKDAVQLYRTAAQKEDKKNMQRASEKLSALRIQYGLTEYAIHQYIGVGRAKSYSGCIGAHMAQKLGTELYSSVKKAMFEGTDIHYRKKGQTDSLEGKKATADIIYKPEQDAVAIHKQLYYLKPIRKSDHYLQKGTQSRIKYCRIVRKPFSAGYRYFVQFVMEGTAPVKTQSLYPNQKNTHTLGTGTVGVDQGPSICAYYGRGGSGYNVLADGVEWYNRQIRKYAQIYERRTRLNNPTCYNDKGVRIKNKKNSVYTKGMQSALMYLKDAYRRKSIYVKQSHNLLANQIIACADTIIKEALDFKALAKRSHDKTPVGQTQTEGEKPINRRKRKKRFGKSILKRSPGLFNKILETKITRLGGQYMNVDQFAYKASQYNHITQEAVKPKLNDRTKTIGGYLVQRDLYSAFLLSEAQDTATINFAGCSEDFLDFLFQQEHIVQQIKQNGDITKNFGLKDFMAA